MREMYIAELYDEENISSCYFCQFPASSRGFPISKERTTYHRARKSHALQLLIVRPRLSAVVRDEDDLFSCAHTSQHPLNLSVTIGQTRN